MTHILRNALARLRAGRGRAIFLAVPVIVAAVAVAGCGDSVPSNGVAKVGDSVIKKTQFTHWLNAAAAQQQPDPASEIGKLPTPVPPDFKACVAAAESKTVTQGKQKTKLTPDQAKRVCQEQYNSLRDQVMQFLIQSQWLTQEAKAKNVKVTDAAVQKQFQDQKKQSFPDDKAYQKFLSSSGMTQQDLLFRVRLDMLTNQLRQKIIEGKGKVTDAQITGYYNKNKSRFSQPERRDLEVVLTKSKAKAAAAKKALQSGQSFKSVAKKYSIDQASKSQGGKLPGVVKGQQEAAFDKAIFSAKKGRLVGPVTTQFGYYVFKVDKVYPQSQQTLDQSKDTIRNLLRSQQEQKALADFVKDYQKKYKDKTNCAKGYVVTTCKNAPKPKSNNKASGGNPQGQPTPSNPQGGSSTNP
ncbi:MAG TPA: peptidyl-prolyl cis-trans isomerase [Thermoleophilaceae bacterium]